jgi:adenylosuccinate synthase
MNRNLAIVGMQWGDEGKGKIVDILAEKSDCVARYQGGHNAGHTVNIGGRRHVLHLLPSGIFHPNVQCVIGSGVAFDPLAFIEETEGIVQAGAEVEGRLFVSNRCHVIFPYHRALEAAIEGRLGDRRIGTTLRGIGPAYTDKMARRGLRMCDLMETETLAEKIRAQTEETNELLKAWGLSETVDSESVCRDYLKFAERIRPFVIDSSAFLNRLISVGKKLLFEGAQATLLDIDHGTYPFVTSSSAAAGGIATGLGISPKHVHTIVGITKGYTTRVGTGPFPTESNQSDGEQMRSRGVEFGSTTGRPRRCGWFDGPAARYAAMINGLDAVVVTKLDVLDVFPKIPFCVDYKYKGSILREFPAEANILAQVEPVYHSLPGWRTSISGVREWSKLPAAAQDYLRFLSDYLSVPLQMVSTGPDRNETIHLNP